jgi:iduronate 2-sulfatase
MAAADRPDVLFIAVDDLRPFLSCYGDERAITPNIDRLAARGLVFDRAYCQVAKCGPSRLSVLSGLGPAKVAVEGHGERDLASYRERNGTIPNLARHFKESGYVTRGFGKIAHDGWDDPRDWSEPFEPGREGEMLEIADVDAIAKLPFADRSRVPTLIAPRQECPVMQSPEVPDETLFAGRMTRDVVRLLGEPREQPLFLAVGYRRPHLPFVAPKKYFDLHRPDASWLPRHRLPAEGAPMMAWFNSDGYQSLAKRLGLETTFPPATDAEALAWNGFELRSYQGVPKQGALPDELQIELLRAYFACISCVDARIGKILDQLDGTDAWSRTIVVLWSDHGWHFGEQGTWSKMTNYEVATRVPLIVASPGMAAGRHTSSFAELLDLYPTLCELADLPVPPHCEGRSLVPVLRDPQASVRDFARSQSARFKTHLGRAVRTADHRYVEWIEKAGGTVVARELYDHRVDPDETRNIASEQPGAFERLSAILKQPE